MPEPNGEENKQLVPEAYESSNKTGNGSLEDYRRVVSSIELRSLKDKTQVFPLDQEHHVPPFGHFGEKVIGLGLAKMKQNIARRFQCPRIPRRNRQPSGCNLER